MMPVHTARLCSGTMVVRTVNPPARTPEAPNPATVRPAIRADEVGARAQTRLPTSNTKRYPRYASFLEKSVYILPARGWLAHMATMKEAPYQPMSRVESNSAVMTGTAVAIRLKSWCEGGQGGVSVSACADNWWG